MQNETSLVVMQAIYNIYDCHAASAMQLCSTTCFNITSMLCEKHSMGLHTALDRVARHTLGQGQSR